MKKFNTHFSYFDTDYSSEGDCKKGMASEACFSKVFHELYQDYKAVHNVYRIKLHTDVGNVKLRNRNNYCVLSFEELNRHILEATNYVDFTYSLEEEKNMYIVTIDCTGTLTAHKFLLAYIRFAYETPFSVCLYEAFKIKEEIPEFKDETILNLFNLVSATTKSNCHCGYLHGIGHPCDFKTLLSFKEIRKHLKKYGDDALEHIHKIQKNDDFVVIEGIDAARSDDWVYKKDRQKRYKAYLNNYKILNDIKK